MTDLPHVIDVTTETFETEVLQRSLQTPVLVDFWATWCGPCKSLGPVLEKLAGEYGGAFVLAKVDVDKEQQVAAAFQIRSVPTVFLLVGGQPVDAFQGALPEGQLRQFLQQHGIEPLAGTERIWNAAASSCSLSTSTLARRKAPPYSPASFSSIGPSVLQGPHQVAQKSTSTGVSSDARMTSTSKVAAVASNTCGESGALVKSVMMAMVLIRDDPAMVARGVFCNRERRR